MSELLTEHPWWVVVSPEIGTVIPVTDDGRGPVEYGCDVALVQARTAKEAKWTAYKLWEKHGGDWPAEREDWHPLHGVKATRWVDEVGDPEPPSERELENCKPFVSLRDDDSQGNGGMNEPKVG